MKIAILGTSPMSFHLAPFGDPAWEIWCLNDMHILDIPRWDRWFQVHPLDDLDFGDSDQRSTPERHLAWLGRQAKPVYLMAPDDEKIPSGVAYPRAEILAEFGPHFLTSAVAWMMAFAITLKPEAIGLYGIDMALKTEYQDQRYGLWFFKYVAERRGIRVVIPPESELHVPPLPYPGISPLGARMGRRRRVFEEAREKFRGEARDAERQVVFHNGMLQAIEKAGDTDPPIDAAEIEKVRDAFAQACDRATRQIVVLTAQIEEIEHAELNWAC